MNLHTNVLCIHTQIRFADHANVCDDRLESNDHHPNPTADLLAPMVPFCVRLQPYLCRNNAEVRCSDVISEHTDYKRFSSTAPAFPREVVVVPSKPESVPVLNLNCATASRGAEL